MRAEGQFEIRMQALPTHADGVDGVNLGHFTIDKEFQGDIEAVSIGEMLSARCPTAGSAGYVAIEQVRGTVHGRSGSFVLQHYGMMHGDAASDTGSGARLRLRRTERHRWQHAHHHRERAASLRVRLHATVNPQGHRRVRSPLFPLFRAQHPAFHGVSPASIFFFSEE